MVLKMQRSPDWVLRPSRSLVAEAHVLVIVHGHHYPCFGGFDRDAQAWAASAVCLFGVDSRVNADKRGPIGGGFEGGSWELTTGTGRKSELGSTRGRRGGLGIYRFLALRTFSCLKQWGDN